MEKIPFKLALAGLIAFGLSACTSAPVTEDQRDTSGQYDGAWEMVVMSASPLQTSGSWELPCSNRKGRYSMQVSAGSVSIKGADQAYIDANGAFKAMVDAKGFSPDNPDASTRQADAKETLYISGNLSADKRSGRLVHGSEEAGEAGCISLIAFKRQETPKSTALVQ